MSTTPSKDVGARASMDQERHAPTVPEQPLKSSRLIRNDQKWESIKNEIYRVYKVEGQSLVTTMRIIEENHAFKASPRKWKMQLKAWNFDKNVSAADMGIVVAKAEKRAREEGKDTLFFHGADEIPPERIENFKRRKTTRIADAPSPSVATPANITYYTPKPVSDEPSLELPEWDVTLLADEPLIPEPKGREIPAALFIEVATTTPVNPHHYSHFSPHSEYNTSPASLHSPAMTLSDEESTLIRPLQHPGPVGTPTFDANDSRLLSQPMGPLTAFNKEPGVNPADLLMSSQLDNLSLKERQPNPLASRPFQTPGSIAPHQSVSAVAPLREDIREPVNQSESSEDWSNNYIALSKVVMEVYPYAQDPMGWMVRVSRVEKIIVKCLHRMKQGRSFEYGMAKMRTRPEPFPNGNEPFPEGDDNWIYLKTVLLELAELYESQGVLLEASLCRQWRDYCHRFPKPLRTRYTLSFSESDSEVHYILDQNITYGTLPSTNMSPEVMNIEEEDENYSQSVSQAKPKPLYTIPPYRYSGSTTSEPVRRTLAKKIQRLRETIGGWVIPNDEDKRSISRAASIRSHKSEVTPSESAAAGFSSRWTTSTRSYKYGVTYSESEVTGVSNSVYMVP